MTEMIVKLQNEEESVYFKVYSVDMEGQNREDYGYGEILAADLDKNILVMKLFLENTGERGLLCL